MHYAGLPTWEYMEEEPTRQTIDAFFNQLTNFMRSMIADLPECKPKEFSEVASPAKSTVLQLISCLTRAAPEPRQTFLAHPT